jgi:hypothetical protein
LFIGAEQTLAELASLVGAITGLPFESGRRDGTFVTREDRFVAVLHEHGHGEDGLLSRYRYALSASMDDGVRVREAPATVMLRLVADQLQQHGGLTVLLVLDLQYRERAGGPGGSPAGGADAAPDSSPAGESETLGASLAETSARGDAASSSVDSGWPEAAPAGV